MVINKRETVVGISNLF